jgi:hypothetical protein
LLWEEASPAALLALLISIAACAWLARQVVESDWVMDADESVHAVEALRRFDRLEHGRIGQFLVDSYLPERWQPPVQDHVRWYAIVHSWSMLPAFALLGPSDVSARIVSVLYLLASCGVLYSLARRLAPSRPALGGLVAVALLLAAPNVITFTPQALTEPCTLFWCLLALLAYVRFVEVPGERRRALLAGAALATAILTKYDHGLLLLVCLGAAELVRFRGMALRLAASASLWIFLIPTLALGLWLAHPDKLAAFRDTLAHPAYGTWRVIVAEFAGSWVYESSSSFGALALIAATFALAWTRLADPRLRAVWMYALLSALLLTLRARFHFRYNLIEVPAFFALAGALAPELIERTARRMAAADARRLRWMGSLLALAGAATLGFAWLAMERPDQVGALLRSLLSAMLGETPGRFGLSRTAVDYAGSFQEALAGATALCGVSALSLGAALLGLGAWCAMAAGSGASSEGHLRSLAAAAALAVLPGAAAFWARAPGAVRWDWEGTPALHGAIAEVADHTPVPGTVLLGGGWDQLSNNTLRWYLLTRYLQPRPAYDDVQVVGDMIGSLVLPERPRIEMWAHSLREARREELPELVVLLDWHDDFLYREDRGPEVELYRAILEQRPAYESAGRVPFDELGLELEIWRRRDAEVPPLLAPRGAADGSGLDAEQRETAGRWSISDRSWRHLDCPWLE